MATSKSSGDSTDSELLKLSVRGDEQAFLLLYRRHRGPVFRFALHMSGSREIAEEVTQEVFLAMLSDSHHYVAERGPLESYLIGIARNHVRRQFRTEPAFDDDRASRVVEPEVFENLRRQEDLRALQSAILSLPPSYREVVALCELEGLSYSQVAEQLGCALGTVRSRLHRARSILGKKLRTADKPRAREGCPV